MQMSSNQPHKEGVSSSSRAGPLQRLYTGYKGVSECSGPSSDTGQSSTTGAAGEDRREEEDTAHKLESWWEHLSQTYLPNVDRFKTIGQLGTAVKSSSSQTQADDTTPGLLYRMFTGVKFAFFCVGPYTMFTAWQIRKYGKTNTLEETLLGLDGTHPSSRYQGRTTAGAMEEAGKVMVQRRLVPLLSFGALFFSSEYVVRWIAAKCSYLLTESRRRKRPRFSIATLFQSGSGVKELNGFILDPLAAPCLSPFALSARRYFECLKLAPLVFGNYDQTVESKSLDNQNQGIEKTLEEFLMECYLNATIHNPARVFKLYSGNPRYTRKCLERCLREQRAYITRDVYKNIHKTYASRLIGATEGPTRNIMRHVARTLDRQALRAHGGLLEATLPPKLPHSQRLFLSSAVWRSPSSSEEKHPATKVSRVIGGSVAMMALTIPYRERIQQVVQSPHVKGARLPHGFLLSHPFLPAALTGALVGALLPSFEVLV
eukprot:gb/GECG01016249.1/.p1 GENE.gb/GECG01016249.1/~~gb/GECG01016249.1/.p1  ORF type:complete len:487 (+),score=35.53 gb/GECG01016249.1/:1-1461(+)